MKNKWIILIIFFTALLSFYRLGSNPPALYWDEAAIGWNAKTIFHTRLDEFGTRLPLSFKSFGDYKAPAYIYLTAPIVGLLGLNPITIRLLSVFAGIASVYLIYLIGLKIGSRKLGITAAILLSVTPWHIMLSRPAFEANLALFFILLGTYLFLQSLKKPFNFIFCALSFSLSLYTYHSPKIFVPFFLLSMIIIYRRQIFLPKIIKWLIPSILLSLVLLTPLIKETFLSKSAARFEATAIFYTATGEKRPLDLGLFKQLLGNYLIHFSPQYLFMGSDLMPRLQLKTIGPLLLIEAPFLLIGLFYLLKNRHQIWSKWLLLWLFCGPLPAMIGKEVPHPLRSYNVLPALIIITALGLNYFFRLVKPRVKFLVIILFLVNTAYFIYHYFVVYPVYAAPDWQYGYQQVAEFARQQEDQAQLIIISSAYGQPYIFTYVYQNRKPMSIFWGAMSKYLFRKVNWPGDESKSNTLIIGSPQEIPADAPGIIKIINFPDGQPAFRIVKTK